MDDEADIGFIDAHAKGIGGHHHLHTVIQKIVLVFAAHLRLQLCVVSGRPDAPALQKTGGIVHLAGGAAIDDARILPLLQHQLQQNRRLLAGQRTAGGKIQVWAVKAGGHFIRSLQRQMGADILPHPGGGCSGKGPHHRTLGQAVHKVPDAQVAGSEILPPLADAVGLVHRHHADGLLLGKTLEPRHFQALRRYIR